VPKVDHKKLDCYRARSGEFRLVDVPPLQYLMIGGYGDPNTSASFREAVETLFPLAYKLKFASKLELGRDYVVMPLEGLWWADDMDSFTSARDKSKWYFTVMIMQPEWITGDMVEAAKEKVAAKGAPPRLDDVRLETLEEGRCVQTLHLGPFDEEAETLATMHHDVIPAQGLALTGKHHEIYLSDLRRTAPNKLRTILRQPVRQA
jgi:hypothetical protein